MAASWSPSPVERAGTLVASILASLAASARATLDTTLVAPTSRTPWTTTAQTCPRLGCPRPVARPPAAAGAPATTPSRPRKAPSPASPRPPAASRPAGGARRGLRLATSRLPRPAAAPSPAGLSPQSAKTLCPRLRGDPAAPGPSPPGARSTPPTTERPFRPRLCARAAGGRPRRARRPGRPPRGAGRTGSRSPGTGTRAERLSRGRAPTRRRGFRPRPRRGARRRGGRLWGARALESACRGETAVWGLLAMAPSLGAGIKRRTRHPKSKGPRATGFQTILRICCWHSKCCVKVSAFNGRSCVPPTLDARLATRV